MKEKILGIIEDLVTNFVFYDRKESDLTVEDLNNAVKEGKITIDEMVNEFRKHVENTFND